ncbi:hypothetical protein [Ferroplasma sp.]|uniref:hypothetical protein n=1 Tax=Ferroplasma sp. TaxID=2591003 RepID=UPI00307F56A4
MPININDYKASGTNKIRQTIVDFLEKNRENAYTLKELKENIAKDHDDWMIHMELTSLIWSDIVEYRDIYDSKGRLVRYFKINEKKEN